VKLGVEAALVGDDLRLGRERPHGDVDSRDVVQRQREGPVPRASKRRLGGCGAGEQGIRAEGDFSADKLGAKMPTAKMPSSMVPA